jgi:hypothetical protein
MTVRLKRTNGKSFNRRPVRQIGRGARNDDSIVHSGGNGLNSARQLDLGNCASLDRDSVRVHSPQNR